MALRPPGNMNDAQQEVWDSLDANEQLVYSLYQSYLSLLRSEADRGVIAVGLTQAAAALVAATSTSPPISVDAPYVALNASTLSCTMGNWTGAPTSYAYQWLSDDTEVVGATSVTYEVVAGDSGHTFTCIVTATNANGSTASPQSNAVAIP